MSFRKLWLKFSMHQYTTPIRYSKLSFNALLVPTMPKSYNGHVWSEAVHPLKLCVGEIMVSGAIAIRTPMLIGREQEFAVLEQAS